MTGSANDLNVKATMIKIIITDNTLTIAKSVFVVVIKSRHLDASIDKLDNLAMNVQLDKEKHMENEKKQEAAHKEVSKVREDKAR